MKRIRVLIVEDSAVVREHLRRIITADPRFEIAGMAATGEEAIATVERLAPDVITMDIHLPGIQGLDATSEIMALRPTPIVIVSGIDTRDVNLTMEALRAGALSAVEKPVAATDAGYEAIAARLRTQLAIMSEVKVVRQRKVESRRAPAPPRKPEGAVWNGFRLLAIAASTGGPNALYQVLSGLRPDFPLPIVLVQHITPGFAHGFGEWLSRVTPFPVTVVRSPVQLSAGRIYLTDTGSHIIVQAGSVLPQDSPPVGGHRPAANLLFSSAARAFGSAAVGVLLTGMGEDGASGLRALRDAGGFTIAEAESTAVVYGMPAAAVRAGAVCESHPLGDIANRLLELTGSKAEVA